MVAEVWRKMEAFKRYIESPWFDGELEVEDEWKEVIIDF